MNELMNSTTIPLEAPVRSFTEAKRKDGKERVPIVYDYRRGNVVYPSKRENVLIEAWCKSFNYAECCRVYKEEFGKKLDPMTCRRWMARVHVQERIGMKLKEEAISRGYTMEKWKAEGIGYQMNGEKDGVKFHQLVAWKELGKACGFYVPDVLNQNNLQINFTQLNGSV